VSGTDWIPPVVLALHPRGVERDGDHVIAKPEIAADADDHRRQPAVMSVVAASRSTSRSLMWPT
jgi:hypothetical protein